MKKIKTKIIFNLCKKAFYDKYMMTFRKFQKRKKIVFQSSLINLFKQYIVSNNQEKIQL